MDVRCQVTKSEGYDPTGQNAVECNAPAEYCPVCEMDVCSACHAEMGVSHEKKPVEGVGMREKQPRMNAN